MDQRERIADDQEPTRAMIQDFLYNTWTAMPGIVQSFNAAKGTVVVQPAIKARIRQQNGKYVFENLPTVPDVPVVFFGGGGFWVTSPIAQGDECLLIFNSRCIDTWFQQGGVQIPGELRAHSIADAMAIIGPFSQPRILANISTTAMELRTADRTCYIQLAPGGVVNIVAPGGLNLTGAMVASGEVTAKNAHTVSAHIHGGVTVGGGNTGTPTG